MSPYEGGIHGETEAGAIDLGVIVTEVGLGLALLLNSPLVKAQTFFRTLIILPWAAPAVLTAMMQHWPAAGQA